MSAVAASSRGALAAQFLHNEHVSTFGLPMPRLMRPD